MMILQAYRQKALKEFRERALDPNKPVMLGMAENPDTFFTHREISKLTMMPF